MAKPSSINPIKYILERQLNDKIVIKNKLFKERLARAKNLYRKDLLAHYGCVNAIEFSDEGELLVSGGDDRRVLLWSLPEAIHGKGTPSVMHTTHVSNIFSLAFDSTKCKIFSGGNDDQVIMHDTSTGYLVARLRHKRPVYGLSVNPQNDYVLATACDDGRILIFDVREAATSDPLCLAKRKSSFHSVMFNPFNARLLATANSEEGIALWDSRKPKQQLIHYDADAGDVSGISVCFNSTGTRLLALRRRLPPVLYATQSQNAVCQFYHPQYYNSCTMKTSCFAGDNDEYILSGSDDFNLYMWRIPKDYSEWGSPHMVLRGHRSIVNQVRYNKHSNLVASSGVEKMIKLWSSLSIGNWNGSLLKEHNEVTRTVYSHDDYMYLVRNSEQRITHDYSDQSTQEDARMMAFFDSLIQREIEGWNSPSEESFTDTDSDDQTQDEIRRSWEMNLRRTGEETSKKQHKPNRIAQLIAQKRDRLAKMAHWKSCSSLRRYNSKEKRRKAKNLRKSKSPIEKYSKNNGTSPKKLKMVRNSSSVGASSAERNSRKHKLETDKVWTRSKKYRTRQNVREFCDSSTSNNSFDAPSTSTGITSSNNSLYRVIEQDSDEEIPPNSCLGSRANPEENLINILPTPINGTHDACMNVLDMTANNVVTIRNEELDASVDHASTSNNAPSPNGEICAYNEDDRDSIVDGSYENYCCVQRTDFVNESDSSECEYNCTPVKNTRNCDLNTPDSGFVTGPCSSNNTYRNSRNHPPCSSSSRSINGFNEHSSNEDYSYETFRTRVKKARLNIRKQIGGDSDSN